MVTCATGLFSRTLTITQKCTYTVWPAVLSAAESSPLSTTGFVLLPGDSNTLPVPSTWSGRLWGRTLCSVDITGKFSCVTGDCGMSTVECASANPALPVTLVEFDFNVTSQMNLYDISLVEGFNLPVRMTPTGGKCLSKGCLADLNTACPMELKVIRDGEAVACKNTCETEGCFSSLFFKTACSDAHVYAHDHAFFNCSSPHYTVTFCPNSRRWRKAENKQEASGDSNTLPVPPAWSGRLWGRTLCFTDITGKFSCVTGDCGKSTVECAGANPTPPVTLVELDFNGTSQMNLYYVSLVEGFNLPATVAPTGGNCLATGCLADLNAACPTELKVIRDEETVGCKNTCQTEACLSSLFFKTACSDARVYAHDGFFTCSSHHYTVTFCPTTSKSWRKAEKKKEASRKNVVKYTGVLAFISVICGFIIFRIRLRLSNRDWEISLSAGTRADTTIAPNA
ncbi:hypothetical protein V8G54_016487 [Vigna mungo]|uniref:Thaumatin-like protein n=1 Tax=Vigna mungo TaxID=3915 RepID=A0AAQ3RZD7_VIGMU